MNPGVASTNDLDAALTYDFQAIGPALRILQLNVEGLSAAKRSLISTLSACHEIDIICLQETHIAEEEAGRHPIEAFDLLCHTSHPKHGRATYVRSDIADAAQLSSTTHCDVIQVRTGLNRYSRVWHIQPCTSEISTATTLNGVTRIASQMENHKLRGRRQTTSS